MVHRLILMTLALTAGVLLSAASPARAEVPAAAGDVLRFPDMGGGSLDLAEFRGRPVLVVNTASRCGFTGQYDGLQALWERYRDRGLVVVGVPSDSFGQELASAAAVQRFCEVNFSIDFPMTDIVPVRGPGAHPFYRWAAVQGAAPTWNFHKILLDGDGRIAAQFPAQVAPDAPRVTGAIERLLAGG